jgi:hypothetical protein
MTCRTTSPTRPRPRRDPHPGPTRLPRPGGSPRSVSARCSALPPRPQTRRRRFGGLTAAQKMRSPDVRPCCHAPNSTLSIFWPDGSAENALARFSTLPPRPKLGAAVFGRRREPKKYAGPILDPGSRPETPPRRFRAPAGAPQVRSSVSPLCRHARNSALPISCSGGSPTSTLTGLSTLPPDAGIAARESAIWRSPCPTRWQRELKRCRASAHVPCWYRRRRAAGPHRPLCWDE